MGTEGMKDGEPERRQEHFPTLPQGSSIGRLRPARLCGMKPPFNENDIATAIIGAALEIHRKLGPGLFESVYETILECELVDRGLSILRQVSVPIVWNGRILEHACRVDLIVAGKVIIEVKSLERLAPVHEKQLLTYLRLSDLRLGLILNFGEPLLKDGIRRIINGSIVPSEACSHVRSPPDPR